MKISNSFVRDNTPRDGETIRLNHNEHGCIGDSESVVIRNQGGKISAKCYRCGAWRVVESTSFVQRAPTSVIKREVSLPHDVEPAWQNIPTVAKEWLKKAYVDERLSRDIGLQWSEEYNKLYIPASNIYQNWWVARSFKEDEARYKTLATYKDSCFAIKMFPQEQNKGHVWIVEDLLSMYRLHEAGKDCMALCTTTISDKGVAMLSKLGYTSATISLDNDNAQVILANSQIMQRLGWMKKVERSSLTTDPKYYSQQELKEITHDRP